ncbi:MAG: diguanylate cyclase [Gammaproteobacteria bacterium]|nr:diguanylate cyclase [Gammaproteobacteria bacterium]MDH3768538.1 diguanylate cyclase [Gammaproteobacteria bacterium]
MHHVLVVDDDAAIRGIVAEVLSDDGHAVEAVESAEQALERLTKGGIDLVITDIRMSGMDGLSLLKEIRRNDNILQVIIMTSHGTMDSAVGALKSGAYDFLTKPFENLEIISTTAKRALDAVKMAREKVLLVATLTRNNEELERMNNFFRDLAIKDGLTNLYNHRHLQEALTVEVERSKRYKRDVSVLFIDVDYFKTYNDTQGHPAGDEVLRSLAKILLEHARDADTVARWGGEEFVILAPETSAEQARELAERLRAAVSAFPFQGRETQPNGLITISVGVATLDPNGSHESLVSRADAAVYEAKAAGRNTVRVAPSDSPEVSTV